MSEKMREQFEAWHLDRYCGGVERLRKCVNAEDVYYYADTQTRWVSWKASREAVVIQMPDMKSEQYWEQFEDVEGESFIFPKYLDHLDAAIKAQGLKVLS
ncbi:hypothetical protein REH59_10520 [Pseudomonas sp. BO3-4]|uniref:hypothetical protein n=1 Tax=Pseudomonas sp. BO3-4 TaxID=3094916 RepID=UPI002A5A41BF|nr:hypothetical protein [Pseudomonas sp. BO3-4]WPO32052.1 hypothetical protein REH59_10520 [Pseudomonas sp. BO3-4]